MRRLKLILRKSNLSYINQQENGEDPDFRATICIEASKYFIQDRNTAQSYFDDFKKRGVVTRGNVFSALLWVMLANSDSLYSTRYGEQPKRELIQPKKDFKLVDRINKDTKQYPSIPWTYGFGEDSGFAITSFYIKY